MDYTTTINSSSSASLSGGALAAIVILSLAVAVFVVVCMWRIFQKAGRPGWAAIVPVYNTWILFEMGGKPGWWSLLSLSGIIPVLGIFGGIAFFVLYIMAILEVAKRFGKSVAFAVFGLIIFPIVGYPMLAFGNAKYSGQSAAPQPPSAPAPTPAA